MDGSQCGREGGPLEVHIPSGNQTPDIQSVARPVTDFALPAEFRNFDFKIAVPPYILALISNLAAGL
jgi:hypothetical protein